MADVAPGIRDDLAAAIASTEAPDEPVAAVQPDQEIPAAEEGADTEAASGERRRGPDGKFLPKDADPDAIEAAPPAAETPKAAEEQPKPEAAPKPSDPTARWPEADKTMFKSLPKEAQDFVLRRHRDMEADYTKKTGAIAEFKKTYEPVDQMFAPFRAQMQQQGWTPGTLIKAWAEVEQQLMSGRGHEVVARIIKDYRVDTSKVPGIAAVQPTNTATAQPVPGPTFDPAVEQLLDARFGKLITPLQQQLQALANEATGRQRAMQLEQQRAAEQTVQGFIDAKSPTGEIAHPFYSEVEAEMVTLARADRQMGKTPDLNELYDRAVWANPSTREKLRAAESAALVAKANETARAKAAAARKASASVTGAPSAGQTPTAPKSGAKSLREALEEAAAEHEAA